MAKHILDRVRIREEASKLAQYAQFDQANRPQPQSIALQKRSRQIDPALRAKRFLDIDRGKNV